MHRVGADVEAARAADPPELLLGDARLEKPHAAALLVAARAERSDVERLRRECPDQCGLVELVVVGEDDDRGLVVGLDLVERLLRPLRDQPIRGRDPLRGEERGARVGDDRRPTEQLHAATQSLRCVDRAVDEDARRRAVPLGEHPRALHVEQVVPAAAHEFGELIDRAVRDTAADVLARLQHEQLRPDAVTLDDREDDAALLRRLQGCEPSNEAHSTASTKTSISPPHGSPTDQARSSEIP